MSTTDKVFNVLELDSVDSTNLEARRRVGKGAAHATILLARTQTAGRGRLSRPWHSAEGGIYATFILRPVDLGDMFAMGVSVRSVLEGIGVSALLKWPNDLLVRDKKIAGILGETQGDALCLGIGINVDQTGEELKAVGLGDLATSVSLETGRACGREGRRDLLETIAEAFFETRALSREILRSRWREKCGTLGRTVRVETPDRVLVGRAADIGPNFELIVEAESGREIILAGDCVHLRSRDA